MKTKIKPLMTFSNIPCKKIYRKEYKILETFKIYGQSFHIVRFDGQYTVWHDSGAGTLKYGKDKGVLKKIVTAEIRKLGKKKLLSRIKQLKPTRFPKTLYDVVSRW